VLQLGDTNPLAAKTTKLNTTATCPFLKKQIYNAACIHVDSSIALFAQ